MVHNEDSRVKIPVLVHLSRLGYKYLSLKDSKWDESTNIFTDIFNDSISRINNKLQKQEINSLVEKTYQSLDNEDLGQGFYNLLSSSSSGRLVDFDDFENNSLHVVTELPYKKDDEVFYPDITLLINGMPLVFIEVKKPNNRGGIQKEKDRMEVRFKNKKFSKFFNITQFMIFSNNMEYDDLSIRPTQGAYYSSVSTDKLHLNYFREEETSIFKHISEIDKDNELKILLDNNLISIKEQSEYRTNLSSDKPTNRICTSLLSKNRLSFLLKYSIAYVKSNNRLEKHIMRYPQIFSSLAIRKKLDEGIKKGIIWHTQGSGKTALAFYNVKYLTDYFTSKKIIPKFYFIVDRISLLNQATREFNSRGLVVHKINSKEEFVNDFKSVSAIHNESGKLEITVVNIQKFQEDSDVVSFNDYDISLQRIYFMDEVHRSYNPKGSFLANLKESDPNAIKIGLTGTPLLGSSYNSRSLFGNYIHKYYYNSSIADGYTLRLIREDIETQYKMKLKDTLDEIKVLMGNADKRLVYSHDKFVEPMLEYIVKDFEMSRISMNDNSIGGMVICDSNDQARNMKRIFDEKYTTRDSENTREITSSILILHDEGTKSERKDQIEKFKDGKIDLLIVNNMLLTGFDCPRLKKLYVGRIIKAHNLLQALTRVNRVFKEFRYGYIVDFAGIEKQFNKTSQDYFNELQEELGDEIGSYSNLFLTEDEIVSKIDEIKSVLLYYDTNNLEKFSEQISSIQDRDTMVKIARSLNESKELYNIIRLSGKHELLDKIDFKALSKLTNEANNHLSLINSRDSMTDTVNSESLLNVALEDVIFTFSKIDEVEMVLADEYRDTIKKTREEVLINIDQKDPEWISLREELERIFQKKDLKEINSDNIRENIELFNNIRDKAVELNRINDLLKAKYENDEKYVRLHKRLMRKDPITESESRLIEVLSELKNKVDIEISQNSKVLENESFSERLFKKIIIEELYKRQNIKLDSEKTDSIKKILVKEYIDEFKL